MYLANETASMFLPSADHVCISMQYTGKHDHDGLIMSIAAFVVTWHTTSITHFVLQVLRMGH